MGDFPDVAGAHGDDEVAGLGDAQEVVGDGVEGVDVSGVGAGGTEAFDEGGGGDGGFFFFAVADEKDFGDDDEVGGGEADGELVEEVTCAGVLVGLEDADEAFGLVVLSEGAEGGFDLGGVVAVVVDDVDVSAGDGASADALHASVQAGEGFECVGDFFPGRAELVGEDGGGGAVVGHVFPRKGGCPRGDGLALVVELCVGGLAGFFVRGEGDLPVGLGGEAQGLDGAAEGGGDGDAVGGFVLDQKKTSPGTSPRSSLGAFPGSVFEGVVFSGGVVFVGELPCEVGEAFDDFVEVFVDVEVVGFEVEDDGEGGGEGVEGAVVFAGFGEEQGGVSGAVAATDLFAVCADDDGGVQA